ncbi:MAG: hypothetical protein QOJ73_2360 [Streptosporangiaceae bacterium]|nr:hypothetical protein [Streptosporangiaceae bacterium]
MRIITFTSDDRQALAYERYHHPDPRVQRKFVKDGHVAFATFFEGDSSCNSEESHPHVCFHYSVEEMDAFGRRVGWKPTYIGDWNHPRNQTMMRFEAT